jgi:recyclin-1
LLGCFTHLNLAMSWNPITPNRSNKSNKPGPSKFPTARFTAVLKPSKPSAKGSGVPLIGRWPEPILLRIFQHLPVPDLPAVARCNKAFARLVRDDRGWEWRCKLLQLDLTTRRASTVARPSVDDDFGDFSAQNEVFEDVDFDDLTLGHRSTAFNDFPLPSRPGGKTGFFSLNPTQYHTMYKNHHLALVPLCRHLRNSPSPSSTLSMLFPVTISLASQATTLLSLLLFLSPRIQPLHDWGFLRQALLAAADRFDSACLGAFEVADSRGDEAGMRVAAQSSWEVWDAGGGGRDQWECGRVWVEKREVFYETGKWDPLENVM